jgi:hypothetical protein
MPLFSVIIPTFNRASLLRQTLSSVWAQRFVDYEIIVVDDGSTDETQPYLKSLGSRIVYLAQANRGPGPARNIGASRAKGEYLAFLDSDDLWFPWTLFCFAELIRRHDHPAIMAAKLIEFDNESHLEVVKEAEWTADSFPDYFASHDRGYFVGAGMSVLRRDEFHKIGGYTDRHINAEDHDLILRMGVASGFVQVRSPVTLAYRRHLGSATMNLDSSLDGELYLIEQERCGAYPGGSARARARRNIITSHTRAMSLGCLRQGMRREAWVLYDTTFPWNVALRRTKYLTAFPVLAALSMFRPFN